MKQLVLASAFLGGLLALQDVSFAHGGQYRGPGDTVPPGGGGAGGGGAPGAPGPAGPAAPTPTAPGRPGATRPGQPAGAAQRQAQTGAAQNLGADLTVWTFWWEFNKEPYLNLRETVRSGGVVTGSEGWFMGRGEKQQGRDSLAPTDEQIRQKVVPALQRSLENETNNDIVTGCLIALAKIGDDSRSESGESEFERIIAGFLDDSNQEISETAAVALGILANDVSVPTLAALLRDSGAGRDLVGQPEVNYRTRAFAAYGLALIGARTANDDVRREIVGHLRDVLNTEETASFDLAAACLIAMGLVPLNTIEAPPVPEEEREPETRRQRRKTAAEIDPTLSRTKQLDYLLAYLHDEANRYLVRAHAPTAVARLCVGANPIADDEIRERYKQEIAEELLYQLDESKWNEIEQSCVLALGLLGDADEDDVDARIREALSEVPDEVADQQARNFAMIAMAKVGGNPGKSFEAGVDDASKFLLQQVARGKSTIQPWAGLAIGVMVDALSDEGVTTTKTVALLDALRSSLREEKDNQMIGAYAIGSGIAKDQEASDILLEKLERLSDDEARGYVAVALGLMDERDAIVPIQKIVRESKYRPDLLKQAAIGLGLLGDKELVEELITMLNDASALATQASIAQALGFIGDQRSVDPLVAMLEDEDLTETARGFAAVALGIVADKELLPWNTKIGVDLNYRASTQTLNDQQGTGILNIL